MILPDSFFILAGAGLLAGIQNALAGGGSFLTFPALMLAGLDPRAANITSTVAMFPGQIATSWGGRTAAAGIQSVSLHMLLGISLIGGVLGAWLLLVTPADFFARLVPWLVLFATGVFTVGALRRPSTQVKAAPRPVTFILIQLAISVYGGYFGGGIGFLMLAALTIAGQHVRNAGATKNLLAMVMNSSAVAIFAFSSDVHWAEAGVMAVGSIFGGFIGSSLLLRLPHRILQIFIIGVGIVLTVWLFRR